MKKKSAKKTKATTKSKSNTIFVQIASYRDPQLLPTIEDMLEKAEHPENIRIGIAWQFCTDDTWPDVDKYKDDSRFRIIEIDYKTVRGYAGPGMQFSSYTKKRSILYK